MGLSGKTTNLEAIYETVPESSRGKMVSMKTQSDRTLFFDLLPLDLGEVLGFKTRFLLYTVPGQVFYNATRKLVLKGADAIVFVADCERGKMDENKESLSNLRANLAEYKVNLDDIPWVIQYNKRDLPDVYTIEELERELNPGGVPHMEAVATQGRGVMETFQVVSKMLLERVTRDLKRQSAGGRERSPAAPSGPAPVSSLSPSPSRVTRFPTPDAPPRPPAREPAGATAWNNAPEPAFGRDVALPSEKARPTPAATTTVGETRFENPTPLETRPTPATGESLVVPVRIPRGQRLREITLRIVIEADEAT
jgi:signal recognition particle receptor subunit beta